MKGRTIPACLGLALLLLAGPARSEMELDGELAWGRRLELSVPLSGAVSEVWVEPGQRVAAGERLLALDRRLFVARLEQARAGLERAHQLQAEAQREWERAQELYDRTVLSDHELTLARIGAAAAVAARQQAGALVTEAELKLEYSRLEAPFEGLVVAVLVAPGQALSHRLQPQPLVVLADDRQLRAVVRVSAAQAAGLHPGREAQVEVNGQWLPGQLLRVGREPVDGGYPAEIGFQAPTGFMPLAGQSLRIRIHD